jgi:hypothetical protein
LLEQATQNFTKPELDSISSPIDGFSSTGHGHYRPSYGSHNAITESSVSPSRAQHEIEGTDVDAGPVFLRHVSQNTAELPWEDDRHEMPGDLQADCQSQGQRVTACNPVPRKQLPSTTSREV